VKWFSVSNYGGVTDFLSNQDEIAAQITVGQDSDTKMIFYFGNPHVIFEKNYKYEIGEDVLSFPCFTDEVMFIDVKENDELDDDTSSIAVNCNDLFIGYNTFSLKLKEDTSTLNTVGKIAKNLSGWAFDFLGSSSSSSTASSEATYRINLYVESYCSGLYYTPDDVVSHNNPDTAAIVIKAIEDEQEDERKN